MARAVSRLTRARNAALAVATVVLAAWLPGVAAAREQHALWAVQGEHNTVYLLGSIHVLRAEDGGLPKVADDAYRDAEKLVMEIDMDDAAQGDPTALAGTMQQLALLPAGQSLRTVLGPDYARAQQFAQQAGLDLGLLDRFAPWFAATALLQVELAKRGFSPELGVEQTLAKRAAADHKPIQGLETAEQQFGILAGLPMPMQRKFLLMTIDEAGNLDAEIKELLVAWQDGRHGQAGTDPWRRIRRGPGALSAAHRRPQSGLDRRNRPDAARPRRLSRRGRRAAPRGSQQRRRPAAAARVHGHAAVTRRTR